MKRLIALLILLCAVSADAATKYVSTLASPSTSWSSCTSTSTPCTLAVALANADDGDVVYLRGGTYTNTFIPANSGSAGNFITFAAYSGETPTIDPTGTAEVVELNNKSYIKLDGLTIVGSGNNNGTIYIYNSSHHIELANLTVTGGAYGLRIRSNNASFTTYGATVEHIWVHGCTFYNNGWIDTSDDCDDIGGNVMIGSPGGYSDPDTTRYITFENNYAYHGSHHVVEHFSTNSVFRGNTLHNEGYLTDPGGCPCPASVRNGKYGNRNVQFYDGQNRGKLYNLIEGNRTGFSSTSGDPGPEGNMTLTSSGNILRYNFLFDGEYAGIYFKSGGASDAAHNRIYNNTLYNIGQDGAIGCNEVDYRYGMYCYSWDGVTTTQYNVIKNNLFYRNYAGAFGFDSVCQAVNTITNNMSAINPLFTNPDVTSASNSRTLPDLTFGSNSPAINQGTYLTTVHADDTGSGTTLKVVDALYFQDGTWGSALATASAGLGGDFQADWIAVGTVGNTVQISSINYSTNTITLANGITRSDGDPVWLYKKSDGTRVLYDTAPDAGAYEYGDAPANPTTVTSEADADTNNATETLTGTAADDDGIASVTWANNRGGSGNCTGTTSWTCADITLYNGINVITVTASDGSGGSGYDTTTLTYYEPVGDEDSIAVTGPQLVYFKATAGNYKITGSVDADDSGTNSFYIDVDSDPADNDLKAWHLDLTDGYESQDARWGTFADPDAYQSPVIWVLDGTNQILYIREREAGTLIQSVTFNVEGEQSPDETAPVVTISTSSPQNISSDELTAIGTATDAVWGTGSVCKFRIGAEPDADNGTACTGTTSWSCATEGYSEGANTLYIECADGAANWSTGNSIVVYLAPLQAPARLRGGTFSGGGSFK